MNQEESPYVSANKAFSDGEKTIVKELLSRVFGVDFKDSTTVEESIEVPPLIVIALGTVGSRSRSNLEIVTALELN